MDQLVSGEQDLELDIEAGLPHATQEPTSDTTVSGNSEPVNFGVSEKTEDDDDLNYPLMGTETSSQSLDLSGGKSNDIVKVKKSRKASKPPRPPKGPSFTANDHKVMKEIAELAMRKRARIERMKNSLRRIKAAKSSSSSSSPYSCFSIFSVVVSFLFFAFLLFQGLFAGNMTMSSDNSPAPIGSPNNQLISVQFYNDFAPVEQTDPSPITSYRYARKRVSGAEED